MSSSRNVLNDAKTRSPEAEHSRLPPSHRVQEASPTDRLVCSPAIFSLVSQWDIQVGLRSRCRV